MRTCIYNGTFVLPDKLIKDNVLIIKDSIIEDIIPKNEFDKQYQNEEECVLIDAEEAYIMPGLIDIHSDYIEGIIQPRPSSMMDFETAIYEAERHLISHGITTIYHSLSLMRERFDMEQMTIRRKENVDKLVHILRGFDEHEHILNHKFHARYEIDNPQIFDYLEQLINQGFVHELSFMDHTPGQGQYRDIEKCLQNYKQWKKIKSDEELERFMEESKTKPMVSHEMLCRLAECARRMSIPLASHDDDSEDKLTIIERDFHVTISEFPITMEVARKAHEDGLYVVMGSPNIMLGGSHSGNLNAKDAIEEGCVDILCSDYYPAALLQSVFRLVDMNVLSLAEATKLVTLNPAHAMGIEDDYGSLEIGKKADIVCVSMIDDKPVAKKCFVGGKLVMQIDYWKSPVRREQQYA